MAVTHLTGYGRISINGSEDESLGKGEFPEILKRFLVWSRTHDSKGFSNVVLQFSTQELRTSLATKTGDTDINAMVRAMAESSGLIIEMATPEEEEQTRIALLKQKDPRYQIWSRFSTQNDKYRLEMLPSEAASIREWAKENVPEEYAQRKHFFNG